MTNTVTSTLEKAILTDTEQPPLKICFVCTGNTCRSPMAAAVLNHLGNGRYVGVSAGIMADKGAPINPKAKQALESAGIISCESNPYLQHTARQLNDNIMQECDMVVGIGAGHAMAIIQYFPTSASKVTAFENAVTDPFGQPQDVYDKCLDDIIKEVKNMFLLSAGE